MTDERNIYQPPQANLGPPQPVEGGFSPRTIELLRKTRPWVAFVAFMGLGLTGLIVLVGLVMTVMMVVNGGDVEFLGIGLLYLFLAVIYYFPFHFLMKYARAIKSFVASNGVSDLENALAAQYSFWRLIGMMTLVVLAIYALIFIVGLGVAAFSSF